MVPTTNDLNQDLINAFAHIGVSINKDDIPIVLHLGADGYLNLVRFHTDEENMSSIYIILNTIRETKNNAV